MTKTVKIVKIKEKGLLRSKSSEYQWGLVMHTQGFAGQKMMTENRQSEERFMS